MFSRRKQGSRRLEGTHFCRFDFTSLDACKDLAFRKLLREEHLSRVQVQDARQRFDILSDVLCIDFVGIPGIGINGKWSTASSPRAVKPAPNFPSANRSPL